MVPPESPASYSTPALEKLMNDPDFLLLVDVLRHGEAAWHPPRRYVGTCMRQGL
jgi:hypothetical protein